jgi:hypothetical protein
VTQGDPIGLREIADTLRQPLSNLSYHARVLAEHDAITMIDQAPVRASMQHFYVVTIDEHSGHLRSSRLGGYWR